MKKNEEKREIENRKEAFGGKVVLPLQNVEM